MMFECDVFIMYSTTLGILCSVLPLSIDLALSQVNERPEFAMNPAWAETGDRYLLKLFRGFVFHQAITTSPSSPLSSPPPPSPSS